MTNEPRTTQDSIDAIWNGVWGHENVTDPKALFGSRLFVEGYPLMRPHVQSGVKRILEVGGGTGRYGLALARDFPDSNVTVTDILEKSLELGREAAGKMHLANIDFKKEDTLRLSYEDNSFDLVFSDAVIQHIPAHQKVVEEMVRVLKPNGILMATFVNGWNAPHMLYKRLGRIFGIVYPYGYEKNFTPNELKALFQMPDVSIVAQDGYNFSYGVYRWRRHWRPFKWVGGAVNRVTKLLDKLTNRAISRNFGFEIFVVAKKIR